MLIEKEKLKIKKEGLAAFFEYQHSNIIAII
jgi:hypothetical protein